MQTRRITCEGYARDDGLYEIESELIDSKPYAVIVGDRERIEASEPFHQMRLRLVIDTDLNIHEAAAETVHAPYLGCPDINPAYAGLAGLNLGPGFMKQVRERFGAGAGCTHLTELLGPAVTTAMQTVWHVRDQLSMPKSLRRPSQSLDGRPPEVDRCHALRMDGQAVRQHYPQLHASQAGPASVDP
ncbi:MAG: DUF2889 domain-containing protein [Ideonella sp.]|nr:DUF2889 domain-containing protein [Ideonella sp.]